MSDVTEAAQKVLSALADEKSQSPAESLELGIADDTYSGNTLVAEDAEFASGGSTSTLIDFPIDENSVCNREVRTAPSGTSRETEERSTSVVKFSLRQAVPDVIFLGIHLFEFWEQNEKRA